MKILTKKEEEEHYSETIKGGAVGGVGGLLVGGLGLYAATLRYPVFRHMSLQLRAFLLTSSTTFGAIVTADHFSSVYEKARQPGHDYRDPSQRARAAKLEAETRLERLKQWGKDNKYKIVGGSWIVSIVIALSLAGRNPYLSTQQKLVQARVYAQGLTIAVMVATAVLEISEREKEEGRWETRKIVDPKDPEHKRMIEQKYWESDQKDHEPDGISEKRGQKHYEGEDQWKDMIEVEEQRLKRREDAAHERAAHKPKKQKQHKDDHHDEGQKSEKKEDNNEEGGKKEDAKPKKEEKKRGDNHEEKAEEGKSKSSSNKEEKK